jgi:hypothetical protein
MNNWMNITDPVWPLLGLIIALTAYVATVRRRVLDKTEGDCPNEKKEQLISYSMFQFLNFLQLDSQVIHPKAR